MEAREKYAQALIFLRKELGDNFLRPAHKNHPFIRWIVEKSTWRAHDLTDLVKTLKTVQEQNGNYAKLRSKFLSLHDCETEAIPFIDIAAMYIRARFKVAFPDEIQGVKNPDMSIISSRTNEQFFVEVSKLGESRERDLLDKNYKQLYHTLEYGLHRLPYSCQQFKYIPEEEMPAVISIVNNVLHSALHAKRFVLHEEANIRLAAVHPE